MITEILGGVSSPQAKKFFHLWCKNVNFLISFVVQNLNFSVTDLALLSTLIVEKLKKMILSFHIVFPNSALIRTLLKAFDLENSKGNLQGKTQKKFFVPQMKYYEKRGGGRDF